MNTEELLQILSFPKFPSHKELLQLLEKANTVLENEDKSFRPHDKNGGGGGLLDFKSHEFSNLPVILIPDLHGRCDFLLKILQSRFFTKSYGEQTVLELLEKGKILVVSVGDLFHSENRGKERWKKAFEKFKEGEIQSSEMTEEMSENISLLSCMLELKSDFPRNLHILKGNHENILNEKKIFRYGNVPFKKFCEEGLMVRSFLEGYYDDLIVHEISVFEKLLPVCAVFENFAVSHAEPRNSYTEKEIINYHADDSMVSFDFTWTALDEAEDGSAEKTLKSLLGRKNSEKALWFSGHRPAVDNYSLRQNGKLVLFHNPRKENIIVINQNRAVNLETDIVSVEKNLSL